MKFLTKNAFLEAINKAKSYANNGRIVTFGIVPNSAETGYGYIEAENELDDENMKGKKFQDF